METPQVAAQTCPDPSSLKVSLGAGRAKIDGFIRVDIDPSTQPDRIMDITGLDFELGTVDVIYASHVLEHLKQDASFSKNGRLNYLISILSTWRKCLKPSGRLYLAVPDLTKLAEIVVESDQNPDLQKIAIDAIFGGGRSSFDFHYSGFTRSLLSELLSRAGFVAIDEFQPFVEDESMHTIAGKPISLNLVAYNSSSGVSFKSASLEFSPAPVDELSMYRRAADERLQEIFKLTKICKDQRMVIEHMDRQLKRLRAPFRFLKALIPGWIRKSK